MKDLRELTKDCDSLIIDQTGSAMDTILKAEKDKRRKEKKNGPLEWHSYETEIDFDKERQRKVYSRSKKTGKFHESPAFDKLKFRRMRELKKPWHRRPARLVVEQVLGYIFQSHYVEVTGNPDGAHVMEEVAFIKSREAEVEKLVGKQHAYTVLDAALRKLRRIQDNNDNSDKIPFDEELHSFLGLFLEAIVPFTCVPDDEEKHRSYQKHLIRWIQTTGILPPDTDFPEKHAASKKNDSDSKGGVPGGTNTKKRGNKKVCKK
uniref:Uncharacterized protein n=1 Tax=Lotharella globosa TaxID=91324 RepID=A0A7S4DHP2_9EUKA